MSESLELSVLRLCVKRATYAAKARRKLEGFRFGNWVRDWVWRTAIESYDNTGEAVSFRVLAEKATHALKTSELPEVLAELRQIRASERLESPIAALNELSEQLRLQRGAVIADELVTAIEAKDVDGVEEAIRKGEGAVRSREREGDCGILEAAKGVMVGHPEDRGALFVPTGFTYLDRRWRGIKVGEVVIYFGVTSSGKSMSVIQGAVKCISRSIPTLIITTEMDRAAQATRIMSRCTGILEEHIREEKCTHSEKRFLARWIVNNWDRMNRLLRLEHFPPGQCSILDVREVLKERQRKGEPVKALFIDSPDHIRGRGRFKDKRDDETEMYYEFQALSEEFGCATMVTTQAKQVYANKICTAEAMGDNYQKSRMAHWLMSINPVKGEDGEDRTFLFVAKRRHGKRGMLIPLVHDYERMRMDTAVEGAEGVCDDDAVA